MTDDLIRKKFPAFEPGLKGEWDGKRRPVADPGTRGKVPPRVRPRSFGPDSEGYQSHEDRIRAMIGGRQ